MISEPIAVTLIAGYLGSGKTTLVNHILNHAADQKIAVLVNDFGDLAIDASLIQAEEDSVISLKGGCVCCSYGNGLIAALQKVLAMDPCPQHILVETSGVAVPTSIVASIKLIDKLSVSYTIVLINSETILQQAQDRYVGSTIRLQLNCADVLVLNKTDLIDQCHEENVIQWLNSEYADASVIATRYATLSPLLILDTQLSAPALLTSGHTSHFNEDSTVETPHKAVFSTFVLRVPEQADTRNLVTFLSSRKSQIVRAKGYIEVSNKIQLLQLVGDRVHLEDVSGNHDRITIGQVVCIVVREEFEMNEFVQALKKECPGCYVDL